LILIALDGEGTQIHGLTHSIYPGIEMHNIVANNNINMSLDFGADDPDIERTLSFLLGNRFRTDERQRVVSQY
jgi:hypothetical protein